jgi:ABC-type nitrate/sulfonate/bicarbonate transport system substrate-binding protein
VPDAVAVMGLDVRSMPALISVPSVRDYAGLRGARLAVDALETGNALVLMGLLEHRGLPPGTYTLAQAGGVMQRFAAVQRGEFAASLFNAPLDALLAREGFNVLDTAHAILERFQGHVLAVRQSWADAHRPALVGVVAALRDAVAWLCRPASRAEAYALYQRAMPDAPPDAAPAAYEVLFHPTTGFPADGAIDVEGVEAVLGLRARYGKPQRTLRDARAYCDLGVLAEAARNYPPAR